MGTPHLNPDKYRFIRALRPFSFSVALVTCGLGVTLAVSRGQVDLLKSILVILAGILLQGASNLANDHADLPFWKSRSGPLADATVKKIRFNFLMAGVFTLVACVIGLWLVSEVGASLLIFGMSGIIAGYFYTGEPIHYKQRGLGIPAVFLLTGVLMVSGAYYAVTSVWDNQVMWISIPVSLLASALLVSNEIRDYLDDKAADIGTLTVRLGFDTARVMYALLLWMVYPVSFYLFWQGQINNPLYLLPSLLFIWQPLRLLFYGPGDMQLLRLPPLTGRFFLIFGIGFILSVL
ncbi:MAG: prenyltransferase [Endozoicomonas sp.]